MNIAFVSCVKYGLSCFEELLNNSIPVKLCITLKDELGKKKSGRVFFDKTCGLHGVKILKINHINDKEVLDSLISNDIDWLFIVGWSQIAGQEVLSSLNKGAIGMHPTLLPEGRGRAPIPWAIIKNLKVTGVTLFKINEKVDKGDILLQRKIRIYKNETATTLYRKVELSQINLIKSIIPKLKNNSFKITKQNEMKASYWPKRSPEDGEISLTSLVADAERKVRALTHPYPGAFIIINEQKIIIWNCKIRKTKSKKKLSIQLKDGFLECLSWTKE